MIDLFAPPTDVEIEERRVARKLNCDHINTSKLLCIHLQEVPGGTTRIAISYQICQVCDSQLDAKGIGEFK